MFQLTQHSRDEQLMMSLIEYFGARGRRGGCGKVYFKREVIDFQVTGFLDLTEIVIPFFAKYPIVGVKSSDFQDFCKVADLMKENKHLTQFGLEQIIKIKAGMNRKRIILLESSIGLQFFIDRCLVLVKKIFFYGLQFFSRSLPCFSEIYSIFYGAKGEKAIPEDIYNILTPVALAHLIQGDGQASRHGLILCTNSYSIQDVIRLMNVLVIRYRLECTITFKKQNQKVEHLIYIRNGSMPLLRTAVKPYMHHSMLYKIENTRLTVRGSTGANKSSFMFKRVLPFNPKGARFSSTISNTSTSSTLDPFWVTGFADAEGKFIIAVMKQKKKVE